jgi:hypothetical protein
MAPFRSLKVFAAMSALCAFTACPAAAITAGEVLKKMSAEERFGYLTGLIDMLAYQLSLSGDEKNASCIISAFYRDGREQNLASLLNALERFPDRRPEAIITVVAKKACEK